MDKERLERKKELDSKRKEFDKERVQRQKERIQNEKEEQRSKKPGGEQYENERKLRTELFKNKDSLRRSDLARSKFDQRAPKKNRSNEEVRQIIGDLSGQNLVSDEENLSFKLNNRELVVNGKKQPAEIHQKLKEKYIQKQGDHYTYNRKGGSTNITIHKD